MRVSVGSVAARNETTPLAAEGQSSHDCENRYLPAPRTSEYVTVAVRRSPPSGGQSSSGSLTTTPTYGGSLAQIEPPGSSTASVAEPCLPLARLIRGGSDACEASGRQRRDQYGSTSTGEPPPPYR